VCHLRIGDDVKKEIKRVLTGVVYMTRSRGPRTEPWALHRQVCGEEKSLLHLTRKQ